MNLKKNRTLRIPCKVIAEILLIFLEVEEKNVS